MRRTRAGMISRSSSILWVTVRPTSWARSMPRYLNLRKTRLRGADDACTQRISVELEQYIMFMHRLTDCHTSITAIGLRVGETKSKQEKTKKQKSFMCTSSVNKCINRRSQNTNHNPLAYHIITQKIKTHTKSNARTNYWMRNLSRVRTPSFSQHTHTHTHTHHCFTSRANEMMIRAS